jgi:hypothetical protein
MNMAFPQRMYKRAVRFDIFSQLCRCAPGTVTHRACQAYKRSWVDAHVTGLPMRRALVTGLRCSTRVLPIANLFGNAKHCFANLIVHSRHSPAGMNSRNGKAPVREDPRLMRQPELTWPYSFGSGCISPFGGPLLFRPFQRLSQRAAGEFYCTHGQHYNDAAQTKSRLGAGSAFL